MLEKQNKYSIRKLTVGAASVLIGASFFAVNGKIVKADTVNDANNVDINKVVQESTGEKAPESTQDGLLKGTDKIEKNSSVESGANANTSAAQVNQDSSVVKDSQQAGGVDASNVQANQDNTGVQLNTSSNRVDGTLQTSAPAKQGVPTIGITQKQDNTINNGAKVPETQTLNLKSLRNIKLNTVSLQDSKVQTQLQTAANNLSFKNASATDTASIPTVLVATDKEAARRQLLDQINQKVQDYQKAHPNMGAIPVTPLDNLTELANLANAKFNVVPNITVTVHFFDDIGTNQDNVPKDITLNNQVVGQVLTINAIKDAIKDNPEFANYNLVPGASYTVAENTPWLVHLTHKTSEHDASLPATRTICVHRPDGTTQTTVQTIGYKYTVTHDLVTNQDFNSEPIFDKDTTETVVTTVDKNGKSTSQTDNSTVFYTKASDGKYYTFNSFKLPTFPGYKIHMTANSSGIEISYARQHLNAINFVDSTDPSNIVKTYNVSGFTGQTVATDISDHIPENWEIVPGSNYPSDITFSTNDQEDTSINVRVQHKYVDVTTGDETTMDISRNIYAGEVDSEGHTVGELEKLKTQTVTLHRTGTKDLVTGEVKWNSYTSGTFEAIDAPTISGYTLSNPNDCKPLTVDGTSHVDDVYLVYKPNKYQQIFNYVDKNGTVVGTYSVDGYTDQTFPTDTNYITDHIPSGWMQVPGSNYPLPLTFGPDDLEPINVQVQHKVVDVTTGDGTTVNISRNIYVGKTDFSGSTAGEPAKLETQTNWDSNNNFTPNRY